MSMAEAAENNLPPGTGLRLAGDVAALQRQLDEANAYIADLEGDRERVRAWCRDNQQAARNRAAQTGDGDWLIRERVISEVWALVKPVV